VGCSFRFERVAESGPLIPSRALSDMTEIGLNENAEVHLSAFYLFGKRAFDVLASIGALIFISPVVIFISVMVKATSRGPVFYRGVRSGLNGRPFRIFKFRSMIPNAELVGGPSTALNDPRLTRVGKILRKYKLDELPQLLNILAGHMSFVGPRPQVEEYTKRYKGEEKLILSVKPGLTDYASLKFINLDELLGDGNVDEKYVTEIEPEKNRLRLLYVKRRSFMEDLRILFRTGTKMLGIKSEWNIEG
jgi:lipopolysaccharide/colanic/teichoic acid biosynthesis glycosyltransferase